MPRFDEDFQFNNGKIESVKLIVIPVNISLVDFS